MRLPSYRWRFAHLAALWAYGVGQPVFSTLKADPEFLVVRGSSRADVILFALVPAFVRPLAVSQTSFHDGRNAVDVYSVTRSGGVFRLSALGGAGQSGRAVAAVLRPASRVGQ